VGMRAHARLRRLRSPGAAPSDNANPWYEVELRESRRDLMRRALFAIDHPVEKVKRVKLGPLLLGGLPEGQYRKLDPPEIAQLRNAVEFAGKGPRGVQKKEAAARRNSRARSARGPSSRPRRSGT